jgi:hypothetical protein
MKIEFLAVLIVLVGSVAYAQHYPRAEDRYDRDRAVVREVPGRAEHFTLDLGERPRKGKRYDIMLRYEGDHRGRLHPVYFGSVTVRDFDQYRGKLELEVRTDSRRSRRTITIPAGTQDRVVRFPDGLRLELHWNYERVPRDRDYHVMLRGAWYGHERAIRR